MLSPTPCAFPTRDLPGFPVSSVSCHRGEVVAGLLEGVPVIVFSGRVHFFETGDSSVMRVPIATLKALGIDEIILTNSAGSLAPVVSPGALMVITDHINFSGRNPLIGEPTDARFVGLTNAYDKDLHDELIRAAARRTSSLRAASTCGSRARPSRRPPRSAWPARSAPTPSACRPCPR